MLYNCSECMVVTNNYFTYSVAELAYGNNVILINRDELKN
ncbi:hypothetical protein HNV12_21760 [Methanococcoides sp. SA1]|nr:hypothetical protein [Methanococcoides sp. SA1]